MEGRKGGILHPSTWTHTHGSVISPGRGRRTKGLHSETGLEFETSISAHKECDKNEAKCFWGEKVHFGASYHRNQWLHICIFSPQTLNALIFLSSCVYLTAQYLSSRREPSDSDVPPEIRGGVLKTASQRKEVNIFQSLCILSSSQTSDLISLRPLHRYTHEVLNQLNYPGDAGSTLFI